MAEIELSFWAKLVLGGLAWTCVSMAFALFLGRLLRDPAQDAEGAGDGAWSLDLDSEEPKAALPSVRVSGSWQRSAFDSLEPAELADASASTRGSGTRYKAVDAEQELQAPPRLRSVR